MFKAKGRGFINKTKSRETVGPLLKGENELFIEKIKAAELLNDCFGFLS